MTETVLNRTEFPDSISIGREGHGGVVKVYLNVSNLAECEKRIDNMIKAREYLVKKLAEGA